MKFLGYGVASKANHVSEGRWPMTIEQAADLCRALGIDDYEILPLHAGQGFQAEPDVDAEDLA